MAMLMDQQQQQQQQPVYKHYCRICKKGFGCGRALGGHMRAHGINDDTLAGHGNDDDDDTCSDWGDEKLTPPPGNKRMYALRTNPNRLKNCRVCENCGKDFVSWKSFLEHGKCTSDDDDPDPDPDDDDSSFPSSPCSDDDAALLAHRGSWSKGKRSRRAAANYNKTAPISLCPSSEEEDLANCLVMLSAARVDPIAVVETDQESCASASKEDHQDHRRAAEKSKAPAATTTSAPVPKGMFECKACKKVFTSHQALGGHRASHKKVKGCFAAKLDVDVLLDEAPTEDEVIMVQDHNVAAMSMAIVPFSNPPLAVTPLKKKSKVHECSICHRQFASGQALGGHKRCHWIMSNSPDPMTTSTSIAKVQQPIHEHTNHHHRHQHQHQHHGLMLRPMFDVSDPPLDLNLPAPADEPAGVRQDIGSPLRLNVPASIYLQQTPWADRKTSGGSSKANKAATSSDNNNNDDNKNDDDNNNNREEEYNVNNNDDNVDDEVDSKVKLAKLSELKDVNEGGEASPWLQVGIGSSSANEGSIEP